MLLVVVEEYRETMQVLRFYATAGSPTDAWLMHGDLSEEMGRWIRENKPEWWPRYRSHEMHEVRDGNRPDSAQGRMAGGRKTKRTTEGGSD